MSPAGGAAFSPGQTNRAQASPIAAKKSYSDVAVKSHHFVLTEQMIPSDKEDALRWLQDNGTVDAETNHSSYTFVAKISAQNVSPTMLKRMTSKLLYTDLF